MLEDLQIERIKSLRSVVIDDVAAYNPETDTLLLMDKENSLAIGPHCSWEELLKKGQGILGE